VNQHFSTRPVGRLSARRLFQATCQHFSFLLSLIACARMRDSKEVTRNPRDHLGGVLSPWQARLLPHRLYYYCHSRESRNPLRQELRARNQKRSSGSLVADPRGDVRAGGRLHVIVAAGRLGCRGTGKAPVRPASMGDLAMPCPGLLTRSVLALASAAIFLRVRGRTRLCKAAPIVEIGPIPATRDHRPSRAEVRLPLLPLPSSPPLPSFRSLCGV
jgi:hypothetical protein